MKILVCLSGTVIVGSAWALPQYRAEEIFVPRNTVFRGMNSFGALVGEITTSTTRQGVLRKPNGELEFVSPPPGFEGYQVFFEDINETGLIAGTLVNAVSLTGRAFVYDQIRGFRIAPTSAGDSPSAVSITDDGKLAYSYSNGSALWDPATNAVTQIPRHGISNAISGGRAVGLNWSWHEGQITELQGAGTKFAQSVAESGVIAGYKLINTSQISVIWGANGTELYADFSAGVNSRFESVLSDQTAVGSRGPNFESSYGTYYSPVSGTADINSLIVEGNFLGIVQRAYHIEENGKVLALSVNGDQARTVILTPVPEPGTGLALGAGLAAMLRRRRAR